LTELGIKDSQSFVKRVEKLTDMQIKYSKKHELHSNFLKSAIEAKSKAEKVLEDVEAAIANLQQLEEGTSMSKLSEMTEQEKAFMNAKNELHKDEVNLEDDFMKEIDDIEKEVATALG
jgi:DNA-directed RNA polymerase beta' subunit